MPDDRTSGKFVYFTMARNRLSGTGDDIAINIMTTTRTRKDTSFFGKTTQEVKTFHVYSIMPT